jgi:23S rRNA (uracil1939-C5)-methyltransferase/tRNA (uracil-5-)-methyltransferase
VCTDPKAVVEETVCGLRYRFVAGEFFQNNPFLLPQLVTYVMEQAQAFGVPYLVDAYCGVGLFALAAHTRFRQVFGIEISGAAVALARSNATLNGIENVTFTEGSAENIFETLPCQGAQTVLVIDPPRRGCDEAFLDQVLQYKPRGIVYVSCAPDTQARDLAYWCTRGYRLAGMQPFDLFPQTRHIESVATLQLVSS